MSVRNDITLPFFLYFVVIVICSVDK